MPGWMHRCCRAAAAAIPASGAGVSLMTEGGARPFAASSDAGSLQLEELQFTLGEGPCVDAFATRRPVLEPDLAGGRQWPGYAAAALDLGLRAVFAFPLQVGNARLGVLDVYRSVPGSLPETSVELCRAFTEVIVEALVDAQATARSTTGTDLTVGDPYRYQVYQAQGMVMVDLGLSLADALARLRAHAYASGMRLTDVAEEVVSRRLRMEPDRLAGAGS